MILKGNVLRKRFDAVRKEAGLPNLRFHDLRHTFASYMIEDGVPVAVVSAALGHTSITTTLNSYYNVINGGKQIADHMSGKLSDSLVPTEAEVKASIWNKYNPPQHIKEALETGLLLICENTMGGQNKMASHFGRKGKGRMNRKRSLYE